MGARNVLPRPFIGILSQGKTVHPFGLLTAWGLVWPTNIPVCSDPLMQVQQTVLGTFAEVDLRTRGTRKQEDTFKAEVIPGRDTTRLVP